MRISDWSSDVCSSDLEAIRVTAAGLAELKRLLTANLRGPVGEFNKLVIALKMRFLHLLDDDARLAQAELLIEVCERELRSDERSVGKECVSTCRYWGSS